MKANDSWRLVLGELITKGKSVSPRKGKPGAGNTVEILNCHTTIDMRWPLVTIPQRKLSFRFACAEAFWILSGDDRVDTIANYAPSIVKFSDNGEDFFGAYGPRVQDQIVGVAERLIADQDTRQAVLTIWRSNPPDTKDVPCTVSIQWVIRDGKLHCIDTMRSSDIWLGWPYDVFNFTMLSLRLLLCLRHCGVDLGLGNLHLNAGSQHLYERNFRAAYDMCGNGWSPDCQGVDYPALNPEWFHGPSAVLAWLNVAMNDPQAAYSKIPWIKPA